MRVIAVGKLNGLGTFVGFFTERGFITDSPAYAKGFSSIDAANDYGKEMELAGEENVRVFEIYVHEIGD